MCVKMKMKEKPIDGGVLQRDRNMAIERERVCGRAKRR
jgi:hypothetical protein